jgi:hypothetical protein
MWSGLSILCSGFSIRLDEDILRVVTNSNPVQPAKAPARSRILSIVAIVLVIVAGLALRSRMIPLPHLIFKYGGDALWALMVFCAVGWVFRRTSTGRVASIAFCISCGVEFSQLYHAPWIDTVRGTRLGALAIGSTFNWPDFVAYALGIGAGVMAELAMRRVAQNTKGETATR